MNNKKLGTAFERELVKKLSEMGCWVHFLTPDSRGAQPFDIIAVKNGAAVAIDCKTSKDHILRFDRLEDNQVLAFEKWIACGNMMPLIAVKYKDRIIAIKYDELKEARKVDLDAVFGE